MALSLPDIALKAKEQLCTLTGLKANTIASLQHDEEGWHVIAEMIEMKRIPDSADILALYELLLDEKGHLVSYQRTRRYSRSDSLE